MAVLGVLSEGQGSFSLFCCVRLSCYHVVLGAPSVPHLLFFSCAAAAAVALFVPPAPPAVTTVITVTRNTT